MPLGNPIEAFIQAQQVKNQNRRDMYGDIAGLGQGLGETFGSIGSMIGEQKKKALIQQIVQAMQTQGSPQQGPQLPGQGMAPGMPAPASGIGGPTQDNTQQMKGLLMQADPQGMMGAMEGSMFPNPEAKAQSDYLKWKMTQGAKQPMEWNAVAGMTDKQGNPLEINKVTGEMKPVSIPGGTKSTGYGSTMGPIRQAQYTIQDLPSNQGPSTAGGAAYQVKVGAKQGKALIAKPGSPQRTAAAAADLVRSITRVAPTDTALGTANFSDTLVSRWSSLKQRLTANPSEVDNPKIRKEMYDIFDEMDKSATPFIANQLDDMADAGFPVTSQTRKRQLGETLPNIPFSEGLNQGPSTAQYDPQKEARYQEWKKSHGY